MSKPCVVGDIEQESLGDFITMCNAIGKLAPKIVTKSSHSFYLVPRRKGRNDPKKMI